ncbi:MAG: twin-arginine translocase TatA/TatE family subunit [Alphaproteobacteria bacterium]|nr:twin-arginine translocase TatA/TatE family subunit [Alphaproteobacteria bacterium]MCB9690890.1 twin-arginine translocase TatA/TatE family subunit [Alphaproteobacteria bacterium]
MVAFIGGLGPWELGIILVIVMIVFGAGKLPQVFEAFGKGVKSFRDAQREDAIDVDTRKSLDSALGEEDAQEVRKV